jgi:hypothetical protein
MEIKNNSHYVQPLHHRHYIVEVDSVDAMNLPTIMIERPNLLSSIKQQQKIERANNKNNNKPVYVAVLPNVHREMYSSIPNHYDHDRTIELP